MYIISITCSCIYKYTCVHVHVYYSTMMYCKTMYTCVCTDLKQCHLDYDLDYLHVYTVLTKQKKPTKQGCGFFWNIIYIAY